MKCDVKAVPRGAAFAVSFRHGVIICPRTRLLQQPQAHRDIVIAQLPQGCRIVEGVVTTVADAAMFAPAPSLELRAPTHLNLVNIAPMGPIVDAAFSRLILRPFTTSTTYRNLKATGQGVFHVTDDALLIARAAIGQVRAVAAMSPEQVSSRDAVALVGTAQEVRGVVLTGACRAYEFVVTRLDDALERTHIEAQVVHSRAMRDWSGFNRAKHAVLEAAILATRVHLTGIAVVLGEYDKLQAIVDKTGSDDEHEAMKALREYVKNREGAVRAGEAPAESA